MNINLPNPGWKFLIWKEILKLKIWLEEMVNFKAVCCHNLWFECCIDKKFYWSMTLEI